MGRSSYAEHMSDLPEHLFADPVWNALHTGHRRFLTSNGEACRYPADVAPFAAVANPSVGALRQLQELMAQNETIWLVRTESSLPEVSGIRIEETLPCLQMVLAEESNLPAPRAEIIRLGCGDAPEMLALTDLAFPGFFGRRSCEMGSWYGVRSGGELIAMGGERFLIEGYPELSAICTHPAHRGKGLATNLIATLVRDHRRRGIVSWLHVGSENRHAIELYERLGFRVVREIMASRIAAVGDSK
jgi:ribosomal protein S18 acetylase RimI-like enzyme